MHLTGLKLGGVPPFTEPILLRFDERVNVFIGPNASGKSTILQLLAECLDASFDDSKRPLGDAVVHIIQVDDDEFDAFAEEEGGSWSKGAMSRSNDWPEIGSESIMKPPAIHIGSVREGLPGISNQPDPEDYGETAQEALGGPFSGSRTMCAAKLLGQERWSDEKDVPHYPKRDSLLKAIHIASACSKRICDEVIRESALHNYIPGPDVRGYLAHPFPDINRITILPLMGVNTTDKRNFDGLDVWEQPSLSAYREDTDSIPIYLGHLSSGTEGTLLWIFWLALKMVHHYRFEAGWEQRPAILLIDEIENHLHPTWQRRVIPALLDHFPGLQIFATTHSPFVVAGLEAGQVHVLRRDENGVVIASTENRDVIGWTADEILRGLMEVDDPTDDATAAAAKELRELQDEGPKSDEKAEEVRQQRIRELRAMVNRDLLAGGPVAAQRELFGQNLAEILEEHRKAQGLNQD